MPEQTILNPFPIEVCRCGYGTKTITVAASSLFEAQIAALEQAGSHEFSEHHSEYSIDGATTPEGRFVLNAPLSLDEVRRQMEQMNEVSGIVRVELHEIVVGSFDDFFEGLGQKLVGSPLLSDISYSARGVDGSALLIEVRGNAQCFLESIDDGANRSD